MPRFGGMGGAFGHMGGGGRVTSAAAAAAFSPLDLTPALWIDPADTAVMFQSNAGTTVVTDGSVCGYAGDKSGNVYHLTSTADDTTRPTWVNNSGKPYLNFTAASSQTLRNATDPGLYQAGTCSIFVAVRANPLANAGLITQTNTGNTTPVYEPVVASSSPTTSSAGFIRNDAGSSILVSTNLQALAFDNTDRVHGIIDGGAGFTPYLDGVAGSAVPFTRAGVITCNALGLCAVHRTTITGFFSARVYGIVIVKRVLTAGEIASLTTYLGAKMGLTL